MAIVAVWVIAALVVIFFVFLLLREFWCWYFKINRLVALMEEQNALLGQQLSRDSVVSLKEFVPTHKVRLLTNTEGMALRKRPDPSLTSFTKIPNGTEVQHLSTGDEITFQDKKAPWFEIRTKDGVQGWCFSGSLEKI
jgi:hypothetical protein